MRVDQIDSITRIDKGTGQESTALTDDLRKAYENNYLLTFDEWLDAQNGKPIELETPFSVFKVEFSI